MQHKPLLACLVAATVAIGPAGAAGFETKAREAFVVDDGTNLVLLDKNADAQVPPASMSKLMTLFLLFEAIRDGRVNLGTEFNVSPKAQAMGGSRMFVEAGTSVPVEALIQGIVVQSGNDACVVVAEGLAGSEATFAEQMTRRAHELGMTASSFRNASGWPAEGHVMSARDLVTLSQRIIHEFPEFYAYFSETEYAWNGITQPNRNPLLKLGIGADGLKTGHTSEAGYGLVGSAVQNGQRIVFMMGGLGSEAERASETEAIVKWAFGAFDTVKFFDAGETVAEADVWLGTQPQVAMVAPKTLQMLVPRDQRAGLSARVVYDGPVEAPLAAGQKIGALQVTMPGRDTVSFDLVAGSDVARGGLMTRIGAAAKLARDRAIGLVTDR